MDLRETSMRLRINLHRERKKSSSTTRKTRKNTQTIYTHAEIEKKTE